MSQTTGDFLFASTYFLTKTKEDRPVEISFGLMGTTEPRLATTSGTTPSTTSCCTNTGRPSRRRYNAKGFCVTQSIQEKDVHKLQISCEVRLADSKENYYMSLKFLGKFDGMDSQR